MYCDKCGAENHDDASFCGECGGKIEKNTVLGVESQVEVPVQKPLESTQVKKSMFGIVIGITIAVLIVAILAGAWLLWGSDLFTSKEEVATAPVTQITAIEEITVTATPTVEPTLEVVPVSTVEPTKVITAEPTKVPDIIEPGEEYLVEIMPSDPSNGEPAEILQIRSWFQATENSLSSLNKTAIDGMTCYRDANGIVKIRLEAQYSTSVHTEFSNYAREYFYHDNQLYFIHIISTGNVNQAGARFYFVDRKVIRYSNEKEENFYNDDIIPYLDWASSSILEGEAVFWACSAY